MKLLITAFSLMLSTSMLSASAFAEESSETLGKLQAIRCNLMNGKELMACFQLGKVYKEISVGNRAEISLVFTHCSHENDPQVTIARIEKFLRASNVIPACEPLN